MSTRYTGPDAALGSTNSRRRLSFTALTVNVGRGNDMPQDCVVRLEAEERNTPPDKEAELRWGHRHGIGVDWHSEPSWEGLS